ncbi:NADH-quinone oxidoreductase subunit J [candidate division KSB1 bacterium]
MESFFFYIFGIIAIASGLMMVLSRNPVHSALFLIVAFFSLSGLFVLLDAHFLAAVQVLVYAGAIMVLFLFVIMLLNLREVKGEFEKLLHLKILGVGAAVFLVFEILYLISKGAFLGTSGPFSPEEVAQQGNTTLVGKLLFTDYLLPFEVTSLLLIVAIIGAIVLAKKSLSE